jgi:hypothetical protein
MDVGSGSAKPINNGPWKRRVVYTSLIRRPLVCIYAGSQVILHEAFRVILDPSRMNVLIVRLTSSSLTLWIKLSVMRMHR